VKTYIFFVLLTNHSLRIAFYLHPDVSR